MSTKLREAAIRLGDALERRGWTVVLQSSICPKCKAYREVGRFCPYCGVALVEDTEEKNRIIDEIEGALEEALYPEKGSTVV